MIDLKENEKYWDSVFRKVIGSAIYTGSFIMCCIVFEWRLAMVIAMMIWGNNIFNNK